MSKLIEYLKKIDKVSLDGFTTDPWSNTIVHERREVDDFRKFFKKEDYVDREVPVTSLLRYIEGVWDSRPVYQGETVIDIRAMFSDDTDRVSITVYLIKGPYSMITGLWGLVRFFQLYEGPDPRINVDSNKEDYEERIIELLERDKKDFPETFGI